MSAVIEGVMVSSGMGKPCSDSDVRDFLVQSECYFWTHDALASQELAGLVGNATVGDQISDETIGYMTEGAGMTMDAYTALKFVYKQPCPDQSAEVPMAPVFATYFEIIIRLAEDMPGAVESRIRGAQEMIGVTDDMIADLAESIRNGKHMSDLRAGRWNLLGGLPHPRGLEGCEFLTSFELIYLWNFDVCDSYYGSLRHVCPVSCNCHKHVGEQCPATCAVASG